MRKNVFITGVSGFVGTHLVDHFAEAEWSVYGHSRDGSFSRRGLKTISSHTSVELNRLQITSFIHLAGIAHDLSNLYKQEDYYRVNFEGTRKAVDEFLKSEATHFIFVSSIKALCDVSSVGADETMKAIPQSDYGKSKRMAEEYILSLNWPSDKKLYILRPAMMHGAGNKGNLNLLYRYAKGGWPFIFGAFSNQRSFHSIENFNFVIDRLVNTDVPSGVYHLADDGYLSTTQLYELICKALGKSPKIWNLKKGWIERLASLAGKSNVIAKLTEDMMVSNKKIVETLGVPLPVRIDDGLFKTILSFDGK